MQTEEFYKKIQKKISENDFERASPFGESQLFEWNKQNAWQRIEQKKTKRKTPFVGWHAVAASIVLLGGLGVYFYKQKTDTTTNNQAIININPTISTQPIENPTSESTQLIVNNDNRTNKAVKVMATTNKQTIEQGIVTTSTKEGLETKEPVVTVNAIQSNVSLSENEVNMTQQTPANDNYRFVPYQGFVEKRGTPQRRERVAILEIPDNDEDYNQTSRKEEKKGLLARLSRKIGKKGAEAAEELPSINNSKPNKVWAFVKESFKNETMAADSTNR